MTIENLVKGYKTLDKQFNADEIVIIADRFTQLYNEKYSSVVYHYLKNGIEVKGLYDRRDELFDRYCSLNYGDRK